MKKVIFSTLILSIVLMTSLIVEPNKSNKQSSREETSDVDKKPLFGEVKIGKQIWMTENLNVDKFRNGDLIQQAKTTDEWEKAAKEGKAACCFICIHLRLQRFTKMNPYLRLKISFLFI